MASRAAAREIWPSRLHRDQQAKLNHLFLRCGRVAGADCALCRPWLQTLPQPSDLPDAAQQSLCLGTAAGWGFDAEKACWQPRPSVFPPPSAPAISRIPMPGGSRPAFSASWRQPEWGPFPLRAGPARQDTKWFRARWEMPLRMGVHESQRLFWESRGGAPAKPSPALAPRNRPGPDRLGSFVPGLNRRPGLNGWRPMSFKLLLTSFCRSTTWSWPLLGGVLSVEELSAAWNRQMKESCWGLEPADNARVCSRRHWSEGLFGYFPLCSGNLIQPAGRAWSGRQAPIEGALPAGEEENMRQWLGPARSPLGRSVSSEELVERSVAPWARRLFCPISKRS